MGEAQVSSIVEFGPFEADLGSHELRRRGKPLRLQEQPFRALALLLARPGGVVSREELAAALWPDGTTVDFDQGIHTAIKKLRRALRDAAACPRFIETVGRRGYRFIAPIAGVADGRVSGLRRKQPGFPDPGSATAGGSLGSSESCELPARAEERRLPATPSAGLTPLVGRERERRLLLDAFDRVKNGEGQVVLASGEPAIGKSRLAQQLRADLDGAPHLWIEWWGSIHHQQTPFFPILERIRRDSTGERERILAGASDGIERSFARAGVTPSEVMPLVSQLLGLAVAERYPLPIVSPEQARRRLIDLLGDWMVGLARLEPIVLVVEDLQWLDPSTLELLGRLSEVGASARLFVLLTARPEFRTPWPLLAHHSQLALNRLSRQQGQQMVASLTRTAVLPAEVVEVVIQRSDGVPLFVEELTKAAVEAGGAPDPKRAIPVSLEVSLQARLDRLGRAKEVAQIGGAIGREFSYALVRAVSELPRDELDAALARLAQAELLTAYGDPPDARFVFRHSLIRDATYHSMAVGRRRELHRAIARAIADRFPDEAQAEPELLAHHLSEAGETEPALEAWQRAAERAAERSALVEATAHYAKALELLGRLPDSPARRRKELALRVASGHALAVTRGWGAPEATDSFARAWQVGEELGDTESVPVLVGLWQASFVRGELRAAQETADQLLRIAERVTARPAQSWAHTAQGMTRLHRGDLYAAWEQLERGIELYREEDYRGAPIDPGVLGIWNAAFSAWQIGLADLARQRIGDALVLTRRIDRAVARVIAEVGACSLYACLREPREVRVHLAQLEEIGAAGKIRFHVVSVHIFRGWLLSQEGQHGKAIAELRQALAANLAIGQRLGHTILVAYLVEACLRAGALDEGLQAVKDGLGAVPEERIHVPELQRLRGALLAARGAGAAEVESCYREALALARDQGAKTLELRAATSLAELLRSQGRGREGLKLLSPLYAHISEGFDTRDLREARALLEKLG